MGRESEKVISALSGVKRSRRVRPSTTLASTTLASATLSTPLKTRVDRMTTLTLSGFWMSGRDGRPLDLFIAGADLGFDSFELSGIHHDTFYDEIRPGDFRIVSVHDPAPPERGHARVGSKEVRRADIVYTSLDEERRHQAVSITKRSIDVAAEYGACVIILHPGQTSASPKIEERLKQLHAEGRITSPEAGVLRARLAAERAYQHREHMDALRRSLDELVAYASAKKVKLGLENRPTYEITNFAEMGEILSWYLDDTVGYWHDTGHAEAQAAIGMTPHADWLRAYRHRIIGIHLHDVLGLAVHKAPGQGGVDWAGLASLVPVSAIRTVEVNKTVSEDALCAGIAHLRATGWIE